MPTIMDDKLPRYNTNLLLWAKLL